MEQQVGEAALALVHPSTDAATRSAASQFLETWNCSFDAWQVYAAWLQSFAQNSEPDYRALGIQLLCFQLLQSKIRREVPRNNSSAGAPHLVSIQTELTAFLQSSHLPRNSCTPACICLAALIIRNGSTAEIIQSCCSQPNSTTAMVLLANIPIELEACSDLPTSNVTAELQPYIPAVLDCIRKSLLSGSDATHAMDALKHWVTTGRVTLSMLHSGSLLPVLVQLLSTDSISEEKILVKTSEVLTEAVLLPTDVCTESRSAACFLIFQAVSQAGCVSVSMQLATDSEWEDACHALASFVCTFVTEEVDNLVNQPAEHLLNLLLLIQNHPHTKVRLAVLECWLTVQEIPTSERHENWKAPLFAKIVESLIRRVAYPLCFQDWSSESELDQSEFDEFRRMVKDVLVSAYFLLRASFVQKMAHCIVGATEWPVQEAALFGLVSTAREVCARVKSNGGGTRLSQDRNETSEHLLHLVNHLITSVQSTAHPLVLARVAEFMGAYAPTWASKCSVDAMFQLLHYLRTVLAVFADKGPAAESTITTTSKAIRSLLVSCAGSLVENPIPLRESLRSIMEAALLTNVQDTMECVAEGCTRVVIQMKDPVAVCQSLQELVGPALHRGQLALNAVPSQGVPITDGAAEAVDSLGRYLHVIQVVIRFCDSSSTGTSPVSELMPLLGPFLDQVSQRAMQFEYIQEKVLSIHEQMLKAAPELVAPNFEATMNYVVDVFKATQSPGTLRYFAISVEMFGSSQEDAFRSLLEYVAGVLYTVLQSSRVDERLDLIQGFFQLNQRYVLYCPGALVKSSQFPSIVACAVELLSACQGERESTRATLNFLSQLFGWKSLRLSSDASIRFQAASHLVDQQRMLHGGRILQCCMATLVDGPQMLWPACTDCVFAILSSSLTECGPEDNPAEAANLAMARHWLEAAMTSNDENAVSINAQVVSILLGLVQQGPKSKAKIKMLLRDYSKIRKGEMTVDTLIAYSL